MRAAHYPSGMVSRTAESGGAKSMPSTATAIQAVRSVSPAGTGVIDIATERRTHPPTGSGPTRFPCLKRLLEQLAERQSVYPGETTEAFARLVANLDAQLLPSRRRNACRALLSIVRRRRRLHGRRHSPLSAIVITCAVTFRAAGEQRKSASPATSSMST